MFPLANATKYETKETVRSATLRLKKSQGYEAAALICEKAVTGGERDVWSHTVLSVYMRE